MAEIKIEHKKPMNIWPWVIAAIVLLLLIWGATRLMHHDDQGSYNQPAATAPAATGSAAGAR
jgi:hypothetical protein